MKLKRESEAISRKELSEMLGNTKRTVCAYENDSMRPSESIAFKPPLPGTLLHSQFRSLAFHY